MDGIATVILSHIGSSVPVYLSVDIDVLGTKTAPETGTPEVAGWAARELIRIIRGLDVLNIAGADVVEVSPPYDGHGEQTSLAAAQIAYKLIRSMVKTDVSLAGRTKHNHVHGIERLFGFQLAN